MIRRLIIAFVFILLFDVTVFSQIDLSGAVIWADDAKNLPLAKPVQVLKEEVYKRTGIPLESVVKLSGENQSVIYLVTTGRQSKLPKEVRKQAEALEDPGAEGFKLLSIPGTKSVLIVGRNARSVLYGIGRLLRKSTLRNGEFSMPESLSITTNPRYPIRGHQLGYRPKTNSYDAFTVKQFDQYIRDLTLFGANSIEILPPRTDDDDSSVHMVTTPAKMMVEQSRIAKSYDLDVWMWYPNMGSDYTHRDSLRKEMQERLEVFAALPRLDHLFVPGGDPGDVEPDVLFKWLGTVATALKPYHPNAKIWVSPQVFRPQQKWYEDFFRHANAGYPWFGGVVFGPWVKLPIGEIRQRLNSNVPIRRYPDITHSLSCQYPVPNWDLAFAMTLGRECINPRPYDQKHIHNVFADKASGSISYSEGTNDDVNKFVWSDQDWDPETPVMETLRDYARLFLGNDIAEAAAQGIVALENNFKGSLINSNTVGNTLRLWQTLEANASPDLIKNFRFQMCLLRAYYDAHIQRRLQYETSLESRAKDVLETANEQNVALAILQAKQLLLKAGDEPVGQALREKCIVLADSLFSSIGAQLTIEKHGAMPGRGNFVDNIDIPLNNGPWLLDQLSVIERLEDDTEKLKRVQAMLNRTNPGPGGFYDHLGNPGSHHRIVGDKSWKDDPGSLQSPRVSFGVGIIGEEWVHEVRSQGFSGQVTPAEWMSQINTLYDTPLRIKYTDLDTSASYKIRITYTGRFRSKIKLTANDMLVHDFLQTGETPVHEFDIPKEATASGSVTFTWVCGEGQRGSQVSEIWMIRK